MRIGGNINEMDSISFYRWTIIHNKPVKCHRLFRLKVRPQHILKFLSSMMQGGLNSALRLVQA